LIGEILEALASNLLNFLVGAPELSILTAGAVHGQSEIGLAQLALLELHDRVHQVNLAVVLQVEIIVVGIDLLVGVGHVVHVPHLVIGLSVEIVNMEVVNIFKSGLDGHLFFHFLV